MSQTKPTLLVVDDDDRIRHVVCAAAVRTKAFATILDEADGRAALDLIWIRLRGGRAEDTPDFILSDLSMPRLDGLQLARELKRHPETAHIPIAIMTSSNRPNDRP
jgi:CheY-like chemotaxis protein